MKNLYKYIKTIIESEREILPLGQLLSFAHKGINQDEVLVHLDMHEEENPGTIDAFNIVVNFAKDKRFLIEDELDSNKWLYVQIGKGHNSYCVLLNYIPDYYEALEKAVEILLDSEYSQNFTKYLNAVTKDYTTALHQDAYVDNIFIQIDQGYALYRDSYNVEEITI